MVGFLPIVYLAYMFLSMYMLLFFLLIFFRNITTMYKCPAPKQKYSVSVVIPAYNEENTLKDTLEAVLKSSYPLEEIIVVNDGSTDRTRQIAEQIAKNHPIIKIINKKNSGKADSLNQGIKISKGELIVVIDSDSFPQPDAIGNMVGFFNDEKVAGVTSTILVRNRSKFMEKLQAMEYSAIAWTRKLLEYVDGIWVTPGPLALYRKGALEKIGMFDIKNLTEDIEIAWKLIHHGYKIRMSMPAKVTTQVPVKLKTWYKQRVRWNVGGMQTLLKYKKDAFKKGLGSFVLPFFSLTMFLGIFGIGVFTYLFARNIYLRYFLTKFSIAAGTNPLIINELYFVPTVFNIFGIALFILGIYFTAFAFSQMKENEFMRRKNLPTLLFYMIVYLTVYPVVLIAALGKTITGKVGWGTK
jgi:biofilm PGA synthesis N-glycosyltransferase PgaC